MPFKQVFERNVNRDMRQTDASQTSPSDDVEEGNVKKAHEVNEREVEEEDHELSEKKERPPRFSTLFTATPPPQVIERYVEQPKRKSGVYLPTPLFVLLAIILFFESTLLFAYTVIGLYNNVPAGILPFGPASAAVDTCNCAEKQAAVKIAPNFYMGAHQGGLASVTNAQASLPNFITFPTISTPGPSTTTSAKSTEAEKDKTTKVVTTTPEQKTIDVTIMSTVTSSVKPPVTSTKWVDATDDSSKAKKRASIKSAVASLKKAETPDPIPSRTTLDTVASKPKTTEKPDDAKDDDKTKTTSTTSYTGGACFGGSGAVALNCPSGF